MIWYVAYGSNLDPGRFRHYLQGGAPTGARREVPGARDGTPPREERAVTVPGRMFFGWTSPTWGGGICFLDAAADDVALGRAYLITEQQLADVAAQEMHREPGQDLELGEVLANRRHRVGPGRYETLHLLGELEGAPLITFSLDDPSAVEANAPTEPYLARVSRGLRVTHDLGVEETVRHLAARPGMAGWDETDLRRVVSG